MSGDGKKMLGLGLAVVGGGALVVFARRGRPSLPDMRGWVWPVPLLGDRRPGISDGFGSKRPGGEVHLGVDVMYPRRDPADGAKDYPPGTPNGAAWSFMPDGTYALAVAPGVVARAGAEKRGQAVTIAHGKAATFYTHMEKLLVEAGAKVIAGQPIGIIGADPLDAEHLKHLHFELWPSGARGSALDPGPLMKRWGFVSVDPQGKPSFLAA